jgi:hypothetical protein
MVSYVLGTGTSHNTSINPIWVKLARTLHYIQKKDLPSILLPDNPTLITSLLTLPNS